MPSGKDDRTFLVPYGFATCCGLQTGILSHTPPRRTPHAARRISRHSGSGRGLHPWSCGERRRRMIHIFRADECWKPFGLRSSCGLCCLRLRVACAGTRGRHEPRMTAVRPLCIDKRTPPTPPPPLHIAAARRRRWRWRWHWHWHTGTGACARVMGRTSQASGSTMSLLPWGICLTRRLVCECSTNVRTTTRLGGIGSMWATELK